MNDPTPQRTILFYRVTSVALLGVVAWLGIALRQHDQRPAPAGHAGLDPAASPPAPASSGLVVRSFAEDLDRIDSAIGKQDGEYWLLQTPFGGLRLVVLSVRQRVPLHLHRVNHEVILPVFGEQEATHVTVREGKVSRHRFKPNGSTLLGYAPYTAHGWANLATAHAAVTLEFSSAPYEGRTYVEADDDRIALGSAPDVFDAQQLLTQLERPDTPSIRRQLPAMGGRITAVAVSSEIAIEPRSGPSAIWVVSGRGKTLGPADHALAANHLAILGTQTPLRIRAEAGAPLLLLDFQPDRLSVSGIVRNEKKHYSQFNEELLIRDFFGDRRGGTFLDVGCADYKRLSTTYYLEEKLGWSGLAVDALSEYADGYAKHRPRTRFLNYFVSDASSGPRKFYRAPQFPELSSASRAVAADQQLAYRGDAKVDEQSVPTITLDDLLRQQGVDKIDFLSMDIEEHEPEALAGFDIRRYRPKLVCVEAHRAVADEIYEYFRAHGYTRIEKYLPFDHLNWYFTPRAPAPGAAP